MNINDPAFHYVRNIRSPKISDFFQLVLDFPAFATSA